MAKKRRRRASRHIVELADVDRALREIEFARKVFGRQSGRPRPSDGGGKFYNTTFHPGSRGG